MYDLLKEFIKPEFLVLVPVLYMIGMAAKRSNVRDKMIPWIVGGTGIALCLVYLLATVEIKNYQDGFMLVFSALTQGVLIAGASVYVNQLIKQTAKQEEPREEKQGDDQAAK